MFFVSRDSMLHPTIDGLEVFTKGYIYSAEYVKKIFSLTDDLEFFVNFEICPTLRSAEHVSLHIINE